MPVSKYFKGHGEKVMAAMKKEDGEEKGEHVFYAKANKMTVAEWVRQVLRAAKQREPKGDVQKKLDIIRESARHSFPSGDIGQILKEIEQGYLSDHKHDPD